MSSKQDEIAVAEATVLGTPNTPIDQAKKEIDAELEQEGSIEDLDFAGKTTGRKKNIQLLFKKKIHFSNNKI